MNWKKKRYSELNVGDKVIVRKDLKIQLYGEVRFVRDMSIFKGKTMTISKKWKSISGMLYNLKEDEFKWTWNKEMLDGGK